MCVDHSRRAQHVSSCYYGKTNDQQVCQTDPFSVKILNGGLQHVEYTVFNDAGEKVHVRGGYLIVDGGYIDSPYLMDPDHARMGREQVLWAEWVESVRKDVECTNLI